MVYVVTMTAPAHRMLRKLPPMIRKYLVAKALELAGNPYLGEQLKGELGFLRSLHTVYKSTHYRIVYEVNERLQEVIVQTVGKRENFYQKLKQQRLKRSH